MHAHASYVSMQHFCFVADAGGLSACRRWMLLTETGSQTSEHLAIDWPGAPKSEAVSQATLCSTDQAPRSVHLCCQSLLSAGMHRPIRSRTPTPLVRPIIPIVAGPGMGAWAGMGRGAGRVGWFAPSAHVLLYVASVITEGAPRNTTQGLGTGCPV